MSKFNMKDFMKALRKDVEEAGADVKVGDDLEKLMASEKDYFSEEEIVILFAKLGGRTKEWFAEMMLEGLKFIENVDLLNISGGGAKHLHKVNQVFYEKFMEEMEQSNLVPLHGERDWKRIKLFVLGILQIFPIAEPLTPWVMEIWIISIMMKCQNVFDKELSVKFRKFTELKLNEWEPASWNSNRTNKRGLRASSYNMLFDSATLKYFWFFYPKESVMTRVEKLMGCKVDWTNEDTVNKALAAKSFLMEVSVNMSTNELQELCHRHGLRVAHTSKKLMVQNAMSYIAMMADKPYKTIMTAFATFLYASSTATPAVAQQGDDVLQTHVSTESLMQAYQSVSVVILTSILIMTLMFCVYKLSQQMFKWIKPLFTALRKWYEINFSSFEAEEKPKGDRSKWRLKQQVDIYEDEEGLQHEVEVNRISNVLETAQPGSDYAKADNYPRCIVSASIKGKHIGMFVRYKDWLCGAAHVATAMTEPDTLVTLTSWKGEINIYHDPFEEDTPSKAVMHVNTVTVLPFFNDVALVRMSPQQMTALNLTGSKAVKNPTAGAFQCTIFGRAQYGAPMLRSSGIAEFDESRVTLTHRASSAYGHSGTPVIQGDPNVSQPLIAAIHHTGGKHSDPNYGFAFYLVAGWIDAIEKRHIAKGVKESDHLIQFLVENPEEFEKLKNRNLAFYNSNEQEWSIWTKGGYHFIYDDQFAAMADELAKKYGISKDEVDDIVLREEEESEDDDDLDFENDEDIQAPPTRMTRKGKGVKETAIPVKPKGVKESTTSEEAKEEQRKVTFVEQKEEPLPSPKKEVTPAPAVEIKASILGLSPDPAPKPAVEMKNAPLTLEALMKCMEVLEKKIDTKIETSQKVFLQGLSKASPQAASKDATGSKKKRNRNKKQSTSETNQSKKTKASSAEETKSK